jgi:ferredoxin-NADP reductase
LVSSEATRSASPAETPLRIVSNRLVTPTARAVRIGLGGAPFSFEAGQAAWLAALPDGEFTPYSVASSPEETVRDGWVEFLVKVDGSTRFGARVGSLHRGSRVVLRGPVGAFVFPVSPRERRFLFVAGGTGIAPLRSMIRHALDVGVNGQLELLYSARSPKEFAYLPELRALAREGRLDLRLTLTGEGSRWAHARGRIDTTQLLPLVDAPDTLVFVCGPPSMLTGVTEALEALGVARNHIRTETWSSTAG